MLARDAKAVLANLARQASDGGAGVEQRAIGVEHID